MIKLLTLKQNERDAIQLYISYLAHAFSLEAANMCIKALNAGSIFHTDETSYEKVQSNTWLRQVDEGDRLTHQLIKERSCK